MPFSISTEGYQGSEGLGDQRSLTTDKEKSRNFGPVLLALDLELCPLYHLPHGEVTQHHVYLTTSGLHDPFPLTKQEPPMAALFRVCFSKASSTGIFKKTQHGMKATSL